MASKKKPKTFLERLNSLPHMPWNEVHHHADYVELMCLASKERVFTMAEYADTIREVGKNLNENPDDYIDDSDDEDAVSVVTAPILTINDKFTERAKNVFEQIKGRSIYFKEDYPFTINITSSTITLKPKQSYSNKLYVFLLFCSSLQYTGEEQNNLTSAFEILSLRTMSSFIAPSWKIEYVGASNTYWDYSGESQKFHDKCKRLAKWLNVTNKVEKEDADNKGGDGGLDLVAWMPAGDEENRNPIFFGQCACSTSEWKGKQDEATSDTWDSRLDISARAKSFMFIPFSYRKADGTWFNHTDIRRHNVLIDRKRYLYFFIDLSSKKRSQILTELEVDKFIKKFTDAKKKA